MASEGNNRGTSRGKRPLTREEKIRLEKKIRERNEKVRKERIPVNDPRRRVRSGQNLSDEERLEREIRRQRKLYEEEPFEEEESFSRRPNPNRRKEVPSKKRIAPKKKKSFGKKLKNLMKVIALILVVFLGFSIFSVASTISKISSDKIMKARPVPMDKTVNILLLGMDVGDIKNPGDTDLKRTDTIMLINFNPKTKKVNMVSIPRDTMITINGKRWKMNAAYPVGGEKEVVRQVEQLLKIDVNYVANINYTAFRDIIDAIGGVTVEIKHNMDYTDKSQNLRIKFKKGSIEHLDGKKAEEFFRWRKNNDGTGLATGDLGRIQNQHELINQVIKKVTSPTIILKLPKILKVVEKNVVTNMPGKTMLGYALKAISINQKNVKMTTIKGTPKMIGGQSYVVFDKAENKNLIKELQEGAVNLGKGNLKVLVINSTNVAGLAASYRTTLDKHGFKNVEIDNITKESPKTYAMYRSKEVEDIAKSELVGISEYKSMPKDSEYSSYDLVVVLGSDSR